MTATTAPVRPGRTGLMLLAALLGLFIALLDITVVNVALPTIREDLDATLSDLEWVANAYLLALAVFIVLAGRLGDLYGRRLVYGIGLAVFVAGSAICGLADRLDGLGVEAITVLHAGRTVQGLGGAVILPLTLATIYAGLTGRNRAIGLMLWGAVGGLATALGPVIGGVLVEHVSWQAIFLVNLPLGLIALAAGIAGIPGHRRPVDTYGRPLRTPLDIPGLVTISASLLLLNLALIEGSDWGWSSAGILSLFGGATLTLVLFLVVEGRSRAPIMNLSWFRLPSFGGGVFAGLLLGAGMFSIIFYISIYLQNGLGMSAQEAGVRLLPMTLILIAGAPIGGKLASALGVRVTLAAAFTLMAIGIALFTRIDPGGQADSWRLLIPGMLVTGLCLGMIMPIVSEIPVAAAPADQHGVSSSVGTMFRQVGNSIGIAVMGALLSTKIDAATSTAGELGRSGGLTPAVAAELKQVAITEATQNMAWFAAAVSVTAAVVVLIWVRDPEPPAPSADPLTQPEAPSRTVAW